eukprot:3932432-Amphidinium_carterae.1
MCIRDRTKVGSCDWMHSWFPPCPNWLGSSSLFAFAFCWLRFVSTSLRAVTIACDSFLRPSGRSVTNACKLSGRSVANACKLSGRSVTNACKLAGRQTLNLSLCRLFLWRLQTLATTQGVT